MKKLYIILFLGLVLRLYHINSPLVGVHAWRQTDTAAIARNFTTNGYNLLYPQIYWSPEGTGFVESEFPIYPYIASILYYLFGENDMFGRLLSVLFSMFTIYGLYLLVRKIIDERTAVYSAFIYAILPLSVFFSRAFMPESAMLMCSVFSVYFFNEWMETGKIRHFFFASLFTSLAALLKLPALYIGLPLLYLAYKKYKWALFKEYKLWLFFVLTLLPVFLWYYHAHQLFVNNGATFNIWGFGTDKWGNFNLWISAEFYTSLFVERIPEKILTFPGTVAFFLATFLKRKYPKERVFDIWLIAILVYFFIVADGNKTHDYYQLPLLLPASVFIGKFFNKTLNVVNLKKLFIEKRVRTSLAALCFLALLVHGFIVAQRYFKAENSDSPVLKIGKDIQSISKKEDFIITINNYDPLQLYHCARFGWNPPAEKVDSIYLSEKILKGAKWLTSEKINLNLRYPGTI